LTAAAAKLDAAVSWKLHDEEYFAAAEAHVCAFDEFSAGGKAFLNMFLAFAFVL
jgi:hypothetical protein